MGARLGDSSPLHAALAGATTLNLHSAPLRPGADPSPASAPLRYRHAPRGRTRYRTRVSYRVVAWTSVRSHGGVGAAMRRSPPAGMRPSGAKQVELQRRPVGDSDAYRGGLLLRVKRRRADAASTSIAASAVAT